MSTPGPHPLRSLFLDLNSYFASVEQQLTPELRGRPIAVVPVLADSGCCVAASYEAKRFGIKTGMRNREIRERCPEIQFVKTRHREYVKMHHRIIAAVEKCLPVEAVMSIDEMACRLSRDEQADASKAVALAHRIKRTIASEVGECLLCSIGIAPNRFLAKVATDMLKPDGLIVIQSQELPDRLFGLALQDLPGIGPRMAANLRNAGITTIAELAARTEPELERAWGGVVGRYWFHWLRGGETTHRPTRKRSIGHQHVLGPESRTEEASRAIAIRLLHKAAARMRHLDYFAQKLSLSVGLIGQRHGTWGAPADERDKTWSQSASLEGGRQDTMTLNAKLLELWTQRPKGTPNFVGVTLHELIPAASVTKPLFAHDQHREKLAKLIDTLDARHGPMTVYTASMHDARDKASGGIAFSSVPDLDLPDTVA